MSTLPPENLAAVAALSSLRAAYPALRELIEGEAYGKRQARKPTLRLPASVLARHDELIRAERAGRAMSARAGIKLSGATAAPVRLGLVDAQEQVERNTIDLCWIVSSNLAPRTRMLSWGPPRLSGTDPWTVSTAYLAVGVRLIPPALAERAARDLEHDNSMLRRITGLNDIRIPLPGHPDCPACGRTALRIDITSPNDADWTITCRPDCLCTGTQCACGRPGRQPGQQHLWPAAQFGARYGTIRTLRRLANSQVRARKAAA